MPTKKNVSTREQFTLIEAFDEERDARFASRDLAVTLEQDVIAKGYRELQPPMRPKEPDLIWDVFAHCRILIRWIPEGAYSADAGRYQLRVDTTACL